MDNGVLDTTTKAHVAILDDTNIAGIVSAALDKARGRDLSVAVVVHTISSQI